MGKRVATDEWIAKLRQAAEDNDPQTCEDMLDYGSMLIPLLDRLALAEGRLADVRGNINVTNQMLDAAQDGRDMWKRIAALLADNLDAQTGNTGSLEWARSNVKNDLEQEQAADALRRDGDATPDAAGAMECLIGGCDRPDCMVCTHYVEADGATHRNGAADAAQSDLAQSTGIVDDGQGGAK